MAFTNLDDLEAYIKEQIASSLSSDVAEKVKEIESDMVQKDVFNAYSTFEYTRRSVGGLEDISNMITSEPIIVGNQIIITIENQTKGYSDPSFYIAPLVDYGDAALFSNQGQGEYTWKFNRAGTEYRFLQPRPFIEDTIAELLSTGIHIDVLQKSLESKGFSFK